jgi:hypothetical protein
MWTGALQAEGRGEEDGVRNGERAGMVDGGYRRERRIIACRVQGADPSSDQKQEN